MSFESPRRVLIVCIGNMCRSPVAEYLLREYAKYSQRLAIRQIQFESAGTRGGYGPMDSASRKYLSQKGIQAGDFQSRLLRRSILEPCDLILTMTTSLKRDILDEYFWDQEQIRAHGSGSKVILYTEAAGLSGDVEDPYGYNWDDYARVMLDVDNIAQQIIAKWDSLN